MSTYFITGATGLIGSALVEKLAVETTNKVVVLVRNKHKAETLFADLSNVSIVLGDIKNDIEYSGDIDFVIHTAAPTSSDFFVTKPVETIDSIVIGTRSVLKFAKKKKIRSMVNLSSMEVYGTPPGSELLTEDKQFYINPSSVRSSYPVAKRLAENMCIAFSSEYGVPVKTIRLAQVLGKTLLPEDGRVIAQFIRAAQTSTDIELATDGSSQQTYISIDDAITGVLTVLESGKDGDVYNLANDEAYCSIYELAQKVSKNLTNNSVSIITNSDPTTSKYPPSRSLRMDSSKLRSLGWSAEVDLDQAIKLLSKTT